MAIDSAAKRASSAGFLTLEEHVIPDGTLDQGDRQTMAWSYGGILAAALAAPIICAFELFSVLTDKINLHSVLKSTLDINSGMNDKLDLNKLLNENIDLKAELCP